MKSPDRSQIDPNPKRIEDLIPPDHKARQVWELVQGLDVTPLLREIKAVEGRPGRPAIDPRILVALWIYATEEGIGSAHRLEARCYDCDPFKWIRGGVDVNYHTLSDFRTAHQEWLRQQVVAQVAALRAEGLVSLETLGQDGMKVRAHAGNDSFRKAETLDRLLEKAEEAWDRLQAEFQQESQRSARQQKAQARAARERLERLKQAQAEVQQVAQQREARKKGDGATARASTTDPEARRIKMGDGGFRPAYNVQFATDLNSLVIVGADLINAGNDAGQMEPMVQRIETEQASLPAGAEYCVDGGYATQDDLESVSARGVVVFAPVKDARRRQAQGKDPYAPQPGDGEHTAAWRQRMGTPEGQAKYKRRGQCEWPNAQCRNHGLTQFLVRGLEKVQSAILWYVLTHNLFRGVALRAWRAAAAAAAA